MTRSSRPISIITSASMRLPWLVERGANRLAVAGRDRLPERVVGREHAGTLHQTLRVFFEQAIEHARACDELLADRVPRGRAADRIHEHEPADLHGDDHEQEQREDPGLKSA